jgi:hypothetical protein
MGTVVERSTVKQERDTVMNITPQELLSYVDQLKSIRPTAHGCAILLAYPKEVVLHADKRTLNCKKPLPTALDRWKYFISVCKGYCAENKIETSWSIAMSIREQYGIGKDDPCFDETYVPMTVPIPNTSKNIKERIASQYKDERPNFDRQKSFDDALPTIQEIAKANPFIAQILENIAPKQIKVAEPTVKSDPVKKQFDQETLDIVQWIKSHWDDTLFPHSNKWVHERIGQVMAEGPDSPQYLDGSFQNGIRHIKRLMEAILNRPVPIIQSTIESAPIVRESVSVAEIEDDMDSMYLDNPDPFGDRL